jgi:hypothetical protein
MLWRSSCKCHNDFMTDSSSTVSNSGVIPDVVDEPVEDLDFWEHSANLAEAGALESSLGFISLGPTW